MLVKPPLLDSKTDPRERCRSPRPMADHQCLPTLSPHGKGRTGPQSNGPQLGRFPVVAVLGKDCRGRGQCGIQNSVDLAVSPLRLLPAARDTDPPASGQLPARGLFAHHPSSTDSQRNRRNGRGQKGQGGGGHLSLAPDEKVRAEARREWHRDRCVW